MKKRVFEYDIVRAIATISVIIVHISAIAIVGFEHHSTYSIITIFVNRLLKFTTPVFIFLAGSLVCESYKNKAFDYKRFLKSRGKRILLPYVIASLVYYIVLTYFGTRSFSVLHFTMQVITGSAQYHLYFIPIILQLYLLTPVFFALRKRINIKILIPAFILISYLSTIALKFQYSDRIFIKFIVPYAIGLYFGSQVLTYLKKISIKKIILLFVITLGIGAFYSYEFSKFFYGNYSSELIRDTGWFVYCILSCFTLSWTAIQFSTPKIIQGISSQFSSISYYVYLIHPFLIMVSEKILNKLGVLSVSLRLLFNLSFVTILSIALAYIINWIVTLKFYRDFKALTKIKKTVFIVLLLIVVSSSFLVVNSVFLQRRKPVPLKNVEEVENIKNLRESFQKSTYVYSNKRYGYKYFYEGLSPDVSNESIKTTFSKNNVVVDIYYENFEDTVHTSETFTIYGNRNVVDTEYIKVNEDTYFNMGDRDVHTLNWSRKPLKYIENDFNHYASIDIIKNNYEVYNITIKSNEPIDSSEYLARFQMIDIDESTKLNRITFKRIENSKWNEATRDFYKEHFIENKTLAWGLFEPTSVKELATLKEIEKKIQYNFMYILQYYDLNYLGDDENIKEIYNSGKVLEFTLQTSIYGKYDPSIVFKVLNGEYDEEINTIIEKIVLADGPVLFRLNNEMNGDWCTYNAFYYQKDSSIYKDLWRYIYKKFDEKGADNVIWVWNPNELDFPDFKWNHYTNYFPGEEYVDIVGVTGYNTGDFYRGETWRSFENIYDEFMLEYKETFIGFPFMITEFGSSIYGGDKAKWIEEMFNVIDKYDFKAAIYWNGIDYTPQREKARIYKFDDDEKIIEIFKKNLQMYKTRD